MNFTISKNDITYCQKIIYIYENCYEITTSDTKNKHQKMLSIHLLITTNNVNYYIENVKAHSQMNYSNKGNQNSI